MTTQMATAHLLRGIDFSLEEVARAMKTNRMLLLDLDLPGRCDLNCMYCDRSQDRRNSKRKEMTHDERKSVIAEASALGCRTIEIPGAGEPLLDVGFMDYVKTAAERRLVPVIFTNGTQITSEGAAALHALGASVILKFNSTNRDVQDQLTGTHGFGTRSETALRTLMHAGFNSSDPTRLGVDMVITRLNKDDVLEVLRLCRRNNIFPYLAPLIPRGEALRYDLVLSKSETARVLELVQKADQGEFGIDYEIMLPVAAGYVCRQINIGMFVSLFGDVFDCNGMCRYLGNIRSQGLAEIWNSEKALRIREQPQEGHCPIREEYWRLQSSHRRSPDLSS